MYVFFFRLIDGQIKMQYGVRVDIAIGGYIFILLRAHAGPVLTDQVGK